MKQIILAIMAVAACEWSNARESLTLTQDQMARVEIEMHLDSLKPKSSQGIVYTPMIVNGRDTLLLPPVVVYGHRRLIQQQRNFKQPLGGTDAIVFKAKDAPKRYDYTATVPYETWMRGGKLVVEARSYCCGREKPVGTRLLADNFNPGPKPFVPEYLYAGSASAPKMRSKSGSANVAFKVNKWDILPSYRSNAAELAKITGGLDSLRNDADFTVTGVELKGYASPEGPYANNDLLARNRTNAVRDYVMNIYDFKPGDVKTGYEPEDWVGLGEMVSRSTLSNREALLAIITDESLDKDARDTKMRKIYPADYKVMLTEFYPALRHCDYVINYQVRQYTTLGDIEKNYRENPTRLSSYEFLELARQHKPDSREYREILEKAVDVNPTDVSARVNAANAAMAAGDLDRAAELLDIAAGTPEYIYARANLAALRGDREQARALFQTLSLPQAQKARERL